MPKKKEVDVLFDTPTFFCDLQNRFSMKVAGCGLRFFLDAHARGDTESGGNGGEDGDYDVQDFTPKGLVFHFF